MRLRPEASAAGGSAAEYAAPFRGKLSRSGLVELELPAARPFHAAGRLVVGGVASRLDLDVDQMEDLRLALEALLLQPPAEETLTMKMTESRDALAVEVGPFASPQKDSADLARLLRILVDDIALADSEQGQWIAVRVLRRSHGRGGR